MEIFLLLIVIVAALAIYQSIRPRTPRRTRDRRFLRRDSRWRR